MTCADTRFTSGTGIEINLERELFARIGLPIGNQFPVEAGSLEFGIFLGLRETFNKWQFPLLSQQHLQESIVP
jgi:hypothetical protein